MSYTTNINQIDIDLKKLFNDVKIDNTDFRQLNIRLKNPINESINSNIELQIFVSQSNLNSLNPLLEWGYYTNSNDLSNSIKFKSNISNIPLVLEDVLNSNKLEKVYLESVKTEMINENIENVDYTIDNINQSYKLKEGYLLIDTNKLSSFFKDNLGIILEFEEISYDTGNGMRKPSFSLPKIGDICEMFFSINTLSYDGNIKPHQWIKLEEELRKLPMVEDIQSNTNKYQCYITFSDKIFVEKE